MRGVRSFTFLNVRLQISSWVKVDLVDRISHHQCVLAVGKSVGYCYA